MNYKDGIDHAILNKTISLKMEIRDELPISLK